jgi:hypothetical protein
LAPIYAADEARGNGAAAAVVPVSLSIHYVDQKIYYLGGEPIMVEFTVTNNGSTPYSFRFADERRFSCDFDVRTLTNRSLEKTAALATLRSSSTQVFFRNVTLETGESFSFTEDLEDYVNLDEPGSYIVQGFVYPNLIKGVEQADSANPGDALASNRLSLNVRPARILASVQGSPATAPVDENTGMSLVKENLPPDGVVSYLLTARQKGNWAQFFLYIDLEAMLTRDEARERQYNAESEAGRLAMLANYRKSMELAAQDSAIATIPLDFTVERTTYNPTDATVTVLERFKTGMYTEKKRYTWYLKRENSIWMVSDYTVANLGTE